MNSNRTSIDWTTVDAVIFDVDGTLFDHKALRIPMALQIALAVARRRLGLVDVRILRNFRENRDRLAVREARDVGRLQYSEPAEILGCHPDYVASIARTWMVEAPLRYVAARRFDGVIDFVELLDRSGIRTGVFSDYPADAKLAALGLSICAVRDAGAVDVDRLKPCPDGFERVADLLGVPRDRCLIIGDRDERDGEAARRGGFRYLQKDSQRALTRAGHFSSYRALADEVSAVR